MLYCCLVANGLASALVNPAQGAFTAVVTPMEKRGQAEGIRRQSADVVSLAGPVGLGLLADLTSCPAAIGLTSLMMATTCALHAISVSRVCASVDGWCVVDNVADGFFHTVADSSAVAPGNDKADKDA